jgi:UDP-N-acetylmuramoylalanine--D-glutamate ligase
MIKRRIVILGAGESGIGSAVLASKLGIKVFLSDNNLIKPKSKDFLNKLSIQYEEGGHTTNKLMNSDYIIKSPGISNDLKIIKKLKLRGKKIISEIEFASKHTNAKLIGITGSNGKTTTALLTYEILKRAGFNVCLAGNIGFSFARQVAEKNYDYYVLEISSFQLDDIVDFAPEFAVITNITPDHLDRYNNNFEEYVKSKIKISKNQTDKDFLIFNS